MHTGQLANVNFIGQPCTPGGTSIRGGGGNPRGGATLAEETQVEQEQEDKPVTPLWDSEPWEHSLALSMAIGRTPNNSLQTSSHISTSPGIAPTCWTTPIKSASH